MKTVQAPVPHHIHNNYIRYIEEFCYYLKEARQDPPSVKGLICGQNYSEFSAKAVFIIMKEFYKSSYDGSYANLGFNDKKILNTMIESAKQVFENFDELYDSLVVNGL